MCSRNLHGQLNQDMPGCCICAVFLKFMDAVSLLHHHIIKLSNAYAKSIPINFDVQEMGQQGSGYQCILTVGKEQFVSSGQQPSKKAAKQAAALVALRSIATDVPSVRRALDEITSEKTMSTKVQLQTNQRLAKIQALLERAKTQSKTSVVLLSELSQILGLEAPDYTVTENYGAVGGYVHVPYKCSLVVGDHYFRTQDSKRYDTMQEAREACAVMAVDALMREACNTPQEPVESAPPQTTNYLALQSIARAMKLTIQVSIECVQDGKLPRFEATAIAKDHQDRVVFSTKSDLCRSKKAAKESASNTMIRLLEANDPYQLTSAPTPPAGVGAESFAP